MELTFENKKLLFYTGLRTDELVKSLGAERAVRDLVEIMTDYMDIANQVNYLFDQQKKKSVGGDLDNLGTSLEKVDDPEIKASFERIIKMFEAISNQRPKPMVLDFSDVQAIAYAVGTYQDGRSWLERTFTNENPLDPRVREHSQYYEGFQQTGTLKCWYFDEDVVPHIQIAANPDMQMDLRAKSLDEMFRKCCDYVNRQGTLLQLADKRDSINSHYADESLNHLKRGFRDHDWSWLTANWKDEELTTQQTKEVAGYFQRQAEIDGLLFKTLHLACLRLRGDSDPVGTTEKLHQEFMDSYKKDGTIIASFGPQQKQ